jgi:hypothetical protein
MTSSPFWWPHSASIFFKGFLFESKPSESYETEIHFQGEGTSGNHVTRLAHKNEEQGNKSRCGQTQSLSTTRMIRESLSFQIQNKLKKRILIKNKKSQQIAKLLTNVTNTKFRKKNAMMSLLINWLADRASVITFSSSFYLFAL